MHPIEVIRIGRRKVKPRLEKGNALSYPEWGKRATLHRNFQRLVCARQNSFSRLVIKSKLYSVPDRLLPLLFIISLCRRPILISFWYRKLNRQKANQSDMRIGNALTLIEIIFDEFCINQPIVPVRQINTCTCHENNAAVHADTDTNVPNHPSTPTS